MIDHFTDSLVLRTVAVLTCGMFAAGALAVAANEAVAASRASHFSLANGMDVVVIPDHRAPVVTHMVWYRVGAGDEPPGSSGIAHFLEHLMFKGTEKIPTGSVLQDRCRQWRAGQRLYDSRCNRLFPAHIQGPTAAGNGDRGRPHDQPALG